MTRLLTAAALAAALALASCAAPLSDNGDMATLKSQASMPPPPDHDPAAGQ